MKAEMFEDLEVWQKGRKLVNRMYDLVREEPFCRDYALRDQILKAAISVPSNVAEGFERQSDQEFIRFLYIAKGSAGEVRASYITLWTRSTSLRKSSRSRGDSASCSPSRSQPLSSTSNPPNARNVTDIGPGTFDLRPWTLDFRPSTLDLRL